eukprot:IDg19966t1
MRGGASLGASLSVCFPTNGWTIGSPSQSLV